MNASLDAIQNLTSKWRAKSVLIGELNGAYAALKRTNEELTELGEESSDGANARAARAELLSRLGQMRERLSQLERQVEVAEARFERAWDEQSAAYRAREAFIPRNAPVFRDDEPYVALMDAEEKFRRLTAEKAELLATQTQLAAASTNPRGLTAEQLRIANELKPKDTEIEKQRQAANACYLNYVRMGEVRSRSSRIAAGIMGGIGGAIVARFVGVNSHEAQCNRTLSPTLQDSEVRNYFIVNSSCQIQLLPEIMRAFLDLPPSRREDLLRNPQACSAFKAQLYRLRDNAKLSK
jgi:hypothetical protein